MLRCEIVCVTVKCDGSACDLDVRPVCVSEFLDLFMFLGFRKIYNLFYSKLITFHRIRRLRASDWFPIAIHDVRHVVHHGMHHPRNKR